MDITAARSNLGLSASAAVTSTGVSGSVEIGTFSNTVNLTECDVAYSVRAVIAVAGEFVIFTIENDTSSSTPFFFALFINGEFIDGEIAVDLGVYDVVVDLNALGLMGRACGNIWAITAIYVGTVEIIDVTFGPPV